MGSTGARDRSYSDYTYHRSYEERLSDDNRKLREENSELKAAAARATSTRIGDDERRGLVDELSDHFTAGRISLDELTERTEKAWQAKFAADLKPLVADLPKQAKPAPSDYQALADLVRKREETRLAQQKKPWRNPVMIMSATVIVYWIVLAVLLLT